MPPRVLIYRSDWLHPSEGFIHDHAQALQRYRPITVGLRRPAPNGTFPDPDCWVRATADPAAAARYAFRALGLARTLNGLIERTRPALLHAHFATDALDLLPLARRHRLPLLVTLHGYDLRSPHDLARRLSGDTINWRLKQNRLFHGASLFLPVSKTLKAEALALGFPAEKLRVHYLGTHLDTVASEPISRAGILYVGRLIARKGLGDLLQALARLKPMSIPLTVIGDGDERAAFEQLAGQLGIDATFYGVQPREAVQPAMQRARLFCMPARHEPFGLVFIEAQNLGTPVVAYADAGANEAIVHGQTGLLAPSGDIGALAAHIRTLMTDDVIWQTLSTNARRHVREHFDLAQQTRKLERIYDEIRDSSRAASAPTLA